MRFQMSGDERLSSAIARLEQEGFEEVREGTRMGPRPLLLVPTKRLEDVIRALRIVYAEDPDVETLV